MVETVMVKPGSGCRVRLSPRDVLHEANTPPEGKLVELTTFVRRRLACGDLVEVAATTPESTSHE